MAVTQPAKRKWADVATVTLVIGETKTAFHIHEAALFEVSPFFKAAFNSEFRESSERTMNLPEDDESVFESFVDWIYRQRYDIPFARKGRASDNDRFRQPVELFVLADKYDVRDLKNLITSTIFLFIKQRKFGPTIGTVAYAYEHTPHNSTIRKLFAEYMICGTKPEWYQQASSQDWLRNHPEICTDAIVSFAKHKQADENPFHGQIPDEYIEKEQESKE